METLIDLYELPIPIIETYRLPQLSPRMSLDLEVDFVDDGENDDARIADPAPSSDRWQRARCWASEEY